MNDQRSLTAQCIDSSRARELRQKPAAKAKDNRGPLLPHKHDKVIAWMEGYLGRPVTAEYLSECGREFEIYAENWVGHAVTAFRRLRVCDREKAVASYYRRKGGA
jgi:hypothetical protein